MLQLLITAIFFSVVGCTCANHNIQKAFAVQGPLVAGDYDGDLLVKIVGGIEKLKGEKATACHLNRNHTLIASRLTQIDQWIRAAEKAEIQTALHFVAQVPSIEIYAYKIDDKDGKISSTKILLYKDHSTLKTRMGQEAEKLVALVNKACAEEK